MTYLLAALGIVVFIGLFGLCTFALIELDRPILAVVGYLLLLAAAFWIIDESSKNSPPCARYETHLVYSAATKTMMPAQFCAIEGTWVK